MSFLDLRSANRHRTRSKKYWMPMISLVAVLITGSVGCTVGRKDPTVEEQVTKESPSRAEAQPQSPLSAPIKEQTLQEQPFRIQELKIREQQGQTVIHASFSNPLTEYRHFPLAQPARIVLDVSGEAKRLPKVETFRIDTHWVSTLRVSAGEGFLRLVVEIAAATTPAYNIDDEGQSLTISIGPVNLSATAKKDLELIKGGRRTDVYVAEVKPAPTETSAPTEPIKSILEEKYSGTRVSLDFRDADIRDVFKILYEISGMNFIITDDVKLRITMRLDDVPWDQALDEIVKTTGLAKEQVGNVIRISTADKLKKDRESFRQTEPPQLAYLSLNYAKAKDLVDKIKQLVSTDAVIVPDDRSNTIVVRGIKKGIEEVTAIVSRLDVRTAQILIESNLIETTPTFARALGMELQLDFGTSGASVDPATNDITGHRRRIQSSFPAGSPFSGDPFFSFLQGKAGPFRNLSARLSAAENEGNVRIISRPSVMTLNNVASTIQSLRVLRIALPSSTNIASGSGAAAGTAVATERIPVGIILTVTPQVSADGFVLMNISVRSSSIANSPTVGGGTAGVIPFDELTREAIANVLVRDGETIVIGGIMKDTRGNSESGIPYLKDIPVLGWLFKNMSWQKDFEELMVFITPRIVSAGSENLPNAEELWRDQMKKTDGT